MKQKVSVTTLIILFVVLLGVVAYMYMGMQQDTVSKGTPLELPITIGVVKYIPLLENTILGFKEGMTELGYVEGEDVMYIEASSMGNPDLTKLNDIAKDFISQEVDMFFTFPVESSVAAYTETKNAERTDIPVIAAGANAPIEQGIIADYKSSGNNVSAIGINLSDVTAKKLEFLKMLKPDAQKIGVFVEARPNLTGKLTFDELQKEADEQGLELVIRTIDAPPGPAATEELRAEIATFKAGDIDAWFQIPGGVLTNQENFGLINGMALRLKIPSIVLTGFQAQAGGLLSYGHNQFELGKQAAVMADKIIKGTHPSAIPVEFPVKYELIINEKTAKAIGITIPATLHQIADQVIK